LAVAEEEKTPHGRVIGEPDTTSEDVLPLYTDGAMYQVAGTSPENTAEHFDEDVASQMNGYTDGRILKLRRDAHVLAVLVGAIKVGKVIGFHREVVLDL
jgi:hypothetical protein